jgi:hypothetical protein
VLHAYTIRLHCRFAQTAPIEGKTAFAITFTSLFNRSREILFGGIDNPFGVELADFEVESVTPDPVAENDRIVEMHAIFRSADADPDVRGFVAEVLGIPGSENDEGAWFFTAVEAERTAS